MVIFFLPGDINTACEDNENKVIVNHCCSTNTYSVNENSILYTKSKVYKFKLDTLKNHNEDIEKYCIYKFNVKDNVEVFHSMETGYTVFNMYDHSTKKCSTKHHLRIKSTERCFTKLLELIESQDFLKNQIRTHGISFVCPFNGKNHTIYRKLVEDFQSKLKINNAIKLYNEPQRSQQKR